MNAKNDNRESTFSRLVKGSLRSIAASFPVFSSFAQAWSEYEGHKQAERVDKFFQHFANELQRQEAKIRAAENHIKESGEFPELIERAIASAQRTNSEQKIKRLAQALVSCISAGNAVDYGDKLSLLDALDSLTENDMAVLSIFVDGKTRRVEQIFRNTSLRGLSQDEKLGLLILSLSKLESRAIIGETSAPGSDFIAGIGPMDDWFNRWRAKYYVLLPFGKLIVSSLSSTS
ncbi:MAG: hypothetical protein ABSF91_15050 [Bacteroidota bacterium]|jgi:hypothetical protein